MSYYGAAIKRLSYPLNELRKGTSVLQNLRAINRSQYLSPDELHELRLQKLTRLIHHAFEHSPFYRTRFAEAGVSPADIRDFDDLRKLPPLCKKDINAHSNDLLADNILPSRIHRDITGGSTGTHLVFYRDNKCLEPKLAARYRFLQWAGWDVGEKLALLWPALQDVKERPTLLDRLSGVLIERKLLLAAGQFDEDSLMAYAKRLHRFAPLVLRSFPNTLEIFARYIADKPQFHFQPSGIVSTGEPLLPSQRELFENVFASPVFNSYVSRECGHAASECEVHDGLHINAESLHLEFLLDGKPVPSNVPGFIFITDLDNYGMPFIRYEITDIGTPLSEACDCGRTLPRMGIEAGRVSDFLVSPHDGSLVNGGILCDKLITSGTQLSGTQLQLIQDRRDHLTIRVRCIQPDCFGESQIEHVRKILAGVFQGKMRVDFEAVHSIAREQSGKYRVCINKWSDKRDVQDLNGY